MHTPSGFSKPPSIVLFAVLAIGVLLAAMGMPSIIARAVGGECTGYLAITPSKTPKPEKITITPTQVDYSRGRGAPRVATNRLCGELVFFTGYPIGEEHVELPYVGLIPCGMSSPYILSRSPRDIVSFYQFRDPRINIGKKIFTERYGYLDTYITGFKNYIGLESCAECGKGFAPTWTQVPLTPYTFTPIPPTRTPWPTMVTPTLTRTLSPDEITPTLSLFELLQGTFTPTSPATTGPSVTPVLRITEATPESVEPFYQRYWPLGLLLFAILIFMLPVITAIREVRREGRLKRKE